MAHRNLAWLAMLLVLSGCYTQPDTTSRNKVHETCIIILSSKGKIIEWNKAAEKMFGWKAEEVLDTIPLFLLPIDMLDAYQQAQPYEEALRTKKQAYLSREYIYDKYNKGQWVNITTVAFDDCNNRYQVMVVSK